MFMFCLHFQFYKHFLFIKKINVVKILKLYFQMPIVILLFSTLGMGVGVYLIILFSINYYMTFFNIL
jgi:hypothetical protein